MKTNLFILLLTMVTSLPVIAQKDSFYTTSGGEMIFSFATIDDAGSETGNIMRWSPVFNFQNLANYDMGDNFGIFTGINVRNVGFIYDNYQAPDDETTVKKKFRNYTVGVPLGIKFGNLRKFFVYGGYEIEFPVNYKEKTFENERKTDKFNVWFSKRVPSYYHTFLVGIQFPYGGNLKFKYYLTNFHNKNFTETLTDGTQAKPYEFLNANVFYISLNFALFKDDEFYFKNSSTKDDVIYF